MKRRQTKKSEPKINERMPFEDKKQCVMTLRLDPELNSRLEQYIASNTYKKRQKKNIIVFALKRFLDESDS